MGISQEIFEELKLNHGYYEDKADKTYIYKDVDGMDLKLYFQNLNENGETSFGYCVGKNITKTQKKGLFAIIKECIGDKDYYPYNHFGWIYCKVYKENTMQKETIINMMNNLENMAINGIEQAINNAKQAAESDKQAKQEKWQVSLSTVCKALWIDCLFVAAGLLSFVIGRNATDGFFYYIVAMFIIAGLPTLYRFKKYGFTKDFFYYQDIEVITTYPNGSKSSDLGYNSLGINIFVWIVLALLCIPVFAFITFIKIIFSTIKYIIGLIATKEKTLPVYSGLIPIAVFLIMVLMVI